MEFISYECLQMVNVYNQKTYKKGVEKDSKIWVTVLTTFGDVSIKIYDVGKHGGIKYIQIWWPVKIVQ